MYKQCPNVYLVTLLNSNFLFSYYREFINCTVNIQINDIRQLPIVIPTKKELERIQLYFNQIINLKVSSINKKRIEKHLDTIVSELYSI